MAGTWELLEARNTVGKLLQEQPCRGVAQAIRTGQVEESSPSKSLSSSSGVEFKKGHEFTGLTQVTKAARADPIAALKMPVDLIARHLIQEETRDCRPDSSVERRQYHYYSIKRPLSEV